VNFKKSPESKTWVSCCTKRKYKGTCLLLLFHLYIDAITRIIIHNRATALFQNFNLYCTPLLTEDILSSPEALWGSLDGTHIMYASFNDSEVRILAFPWFGSSSISGSFKGGAGMWTTFPESRTVRYPTVSFGVQWRSERFGHCLINFRRKAT